MRGLPLVALLAAAASLAGCAAPAGTEPVDDTAATPGVEIVSDEDLEDGATYTTAILEDGTFQHARLEVAAGTTLVWWNVDDVTHSVVSDDGAFAGSGPIAPGEEYERTFQVPGTYAYHCRYHPEMRGVLVVT